MRRSPGPDERQRDAERSRQQLLDAAVVEFGAHGFSGARVGAIADRAGVNKQLISYYFGGKEGLYRAVADRWRAEEPAVAEDPGTLADLVGAYAQVTIEQPDLLRLLVREGLDRDTAAGDEEAQYRRFQGMLADFRRRQSEGELPDDVDPAYAALALFGISAAPVVFPQIARALGIDPDDAGQYAEQAARLVEQLRSRP
ncbi:TetR family transcriptional regulator [Kribbella sp. NPDC005582]|uniref:TetR/AcrR family transcriptional regulator n=1 Tax=Kribbella sp. NPDC005582 TaxID=3156893 RepID=UPI0033AEEAC7